MAPVRVEGLQETVERLKELPQELSGRNGGPIRKALFQAAKIIEEETKKRAPRDTGTLAANIKKRRNSNPQRLEGSPVEVYHVGVDKDVAWYWHFSEFGTVREPAKPYLRSAFEMKQQESVDRFAEVLKKDIDRLERKV